ncbi:putative C2 domain-containing protein [Medicago truncatula]|uniref:Calcium-dependent lipid-binding (CaLB domain) family protein n=1 Tax=Medicago truncatula TaxID=3880 RepID=A0A072U4F1_MEDTR|nr:uncharacterized protein LOC25499702 [Medicago truncatula]KEH24577.1 calcium-dependent lipid-binding (CaLB domain) family protein [Medicago truncatula]RHN49431.1 putative C2 domain-containing protein [Medicago truncatula]
MSYLSSSSPYQLLEINIISAQDLSGVAKSVKAYAVAWLHPERKLATQIDQVGHTNPTWNEKFVFRVDNEFLNSESSVIMIEIYNSAWLRDILIGTVVVLVNNLLPTVTLSGNRKPKLRFVGLQIRRPSGRPQGILNIGVTLLDSTMRSMPLYSELSTSAVGYWDMMDSNSNKRKVNNNYNDNNSIVTDDSKMMLTLQRCQSEKNDSTINDYTYHGAGKNNYNGYEESEASMPLPRKRGNEESLCSDVGPSPSVVAAAIAKGLYLMPPPSRKVKSSAVGGWSESNYTEGMDTKIERWRNELTPAYDEEFEELDEEIKKRMVVAKKTPKRSGKTPGRPMSKKGKLCSCFGTMFGCEFSITCGGGGNNKKKRGNDKAHLTSASELTYDESRI